MNLTSLTRATIVPTLNRVHSASLKGLPTRPGIKAFAQSYLDAKDSAPAAVTSLIRYQTAKASATGFATGLGGAATLPASLPAEVAGTLYIQFRMIAAIAYIHGHDPHSDQVKTIAFAALLGKKATKVLREIGIDIGKKVATEALKRLPGRVLTKINKQVGFRLLTKFGQTGSINLVKWIPVAGGVVGGAVDGVTTNGIGTAARQLLPPVSADVSST